MFRRQSIVGWGRRNSRLGRECQRRRVRPIPES
jgi:hypothetical protein